MLHAANLASLQIKLAFENAKNVKSKQSSTDLVTETDQLSELIIFTYLREKFPDAKFIGEETEATLGNNYKLDKIGTFIVDPIDGTTNFVHTNPMIAISIGYFVDAKPQVAVCVNPILNDIYWAIRGFGTFKNGRPVHVSKVKTLQQSVVTTNVGYDRDAEKFSKISGMLNVLMCEKKIHGIRMTGSAVISAMLVCEGAVEAYYEKGIHIWDIAAGSLLVMEAGGIAMDPSGGEVDWISRRILIANNAQVANELAEIHKKFD